MHSRSGIRVLHVLESTLGGTLRYLENIAEATKDGSIVSGLAFGTSRADSRFLPFLENVRKLGWQCFETAMRREIDAPSDLKSCWQLCRAISTFKPDILHCHSSKAGALGRIAARVTCSQSRIAYSPHAVAVALGRKYLYIEKLLAPITDRYIAVSDSEAEQISNLGLRNKSDIDVVYPTVDCRYFHPRNRNTAKAKLDLSGKHVVLGIGRITAQKDPESFLSIFSLVERQIENVQAVWVGGEEGKQDFAHWIRNRNLEQKVQLVPWQQDIRPYIAAADVLLSTSKFESFGYMVGEALAMQIPVVATDITGTMDVMSGALKENLYDPGDFAKAARLVCRMLRNSEIAAQVAAAGREMIIERFASDRMLHSLLVAYEKLLRSYKNGVSIRQEPA